jgi:uncharacterized phiE125 gp8 family phage protein
MSLIRIGDPPALAVTLAELRAQLRLDDLGHDEDALIVAYARAAQEHIEKTLGRTLPVTSWRLTLDGFPWSHVIDIPMPPLISVDAFTHVDTDGVTQDVVDYDVFGVGGFGMVAPAYEAHWPDTRRHLGVVSVDFTAGSEQVPEPIRHAMMLMVSGMFDDRSGDCAVGPAAESLLRPYRVW